MIISLNNYNVDVLPAKEGGIWIKSRDVMRMLGFKNKGASLSQYITRYGFKDSKSAGTKRFNRMLYIKDILLYNVLTAWAKCPTTSRPWAASAAALAMAVLDAYNSGPKPKDWHTTNTNLLILNPDANEFPTYRKQSNKAKVIGFSESVASELLRKAENKCQSLEKALANRENTIKSLQQQVKITSAPVTDEKMVSLFNTIKAISQNTEIPHLQFRHTVWTLIEHFISKGEVKIIPMTNNG